MNKKEQVEKLRDFIVNALSEDKAEDILVVDLEGKTDFAKFMIVATGRSTKHVSSLADSLAVGILKEGMKSVNIEGKGVGDWVLIDAFDIVIHIFRQEIRELYSIEKIWELTTSAH